MQTSEEQNITVNLDKYGNLLIEISPLSQIKNIVTVAILVIVLGVIIGAIGGIIIAIFVSFSERICAQILAGGHLGVIAGLAAGTVSGMLLGVKARKNSSYFQMVMITKFALEVLFWTLVGASVGFWLGELGMFLGGNPSRADKIVIMLAAGVMGGFIGAAENHPYSIRGLNWVLGGSVGGALAGGSIGGLTGAYVGSLGGALTGYVFQKLVAVIGQKAELLESLADSLMDWLNVFMDYVFLVTCLALIAAAPWTVRSNMFSQGVITAAVATLNILVFVPLLRKLKWLRYWGIITLAFTVSLSILAGGWFGGLLGMVVGGLLGGTLIGRKIIPYRRRTARSRALVIGLMTGMIMGLYLGAMKFILLGENLAFLGMVIPIVMALQITGVILGAVAGIIVWDLWRKVPPKVDFLQKVFFKTRGEGGDYSELGSRGAEDRRGNDFWKERSRCSH